MSTLLDRVRELTNLDGVSGQEQPVVAYLVDALTPLCDEVEVDSAGNIYATRRGSAPGPTVMIAAHTDEIGLMVKSVEPSGFLRFEKIGGVIDNLLAARLVRIRGQLGVIGMKAGHYQSPVERSQATPHHEMYIDLGCRSAAEVAARGIGVGDAIAFVSPLVELGGGLIAGQAVDNRLGCAVLLQLIQEAAPPAGTLVAAFTTQEEVGLNGAAVAGFKVRPDLGLAVDTMPCGDTPDMNIHTELSARLGGGPCLQVSSGRSGTGFLTPLPVREFLVGTARAADLPVQLVTFSAGNNDAAAIGWSAEGVPAASICLPRRYAHSPLEVADLSDAEVTHALLRAIVARMDALPSFDFLMG